jgi:hypothetical protein
MTYQRFEFQDDQYLEALTQFSTLLRELEQQEICRMVLRRDPSLGECDLDCMIVRHKRLSRVSMGPLVHRVVTKILMRGPEFQRLNRLIPSGLHLDATLQVRVVRRGDRRLLRLVRAIPVSGH